MGMVLVLSSERFSSLALPEEPALLSLVPREIGRWRGEDLDQKLALELFLLKDPTFFKALVRAYARSSNGSKVLLTSLEDLKGFQREVHDPRFCYESRGWTVQSYTDFPVSIGHGKNGTLKLLTYSSNTTAEKRMELFGYLMGGDIFTSEAALRWGHIRNRLKRLVRAGREHVVYLSLSADIPAAGQGALAGEMKVMMENILSAVLAGKRG